MKHLLFLVLILFSLNSQAFNPNDLIGSDIKQVAPCNGMICSLVEKDGKHYVIMGQPIDEETLGVVAVYIVEGKKLKLIWSILWTDT